MCVCVCVARSTAIMALLSHRGSVFRLGPAWYSWSVRSGRRIAPLCRKGGKGLPTWALYRRGRCIEPLCRKGGKGLPTWALYRRGRCIEPRMSEPPFPTAASSRTRPALGAGYTSVLGRDRKHARYSQGRASRAGCSTVVQLVVFGGVQLDRDATPPSTV